MIARKDHPTTSRRARIEPVHALAIASRFAVRERARVKRLALNSARRRIARNRPPTPAPTNSCVATNSAASTNAATAAKAKFTKQQVARRLREINLLFQEGVLTEEFYHQKIAECEAM